MISRDDVKKLANLSRIEVSDAEEEAFVYEIDSILEYVGQVSGLVTSAENELPPVRNMFRKDENPHESGLFTDAILRGAPSVQDSYIKVKKILSND